MNSKERFTTSAKLVTITFMVGSVALLVARGPFHYSEASVPTTSSSHWSRRRKTGRLAEAGHLRCCRQSRGSG
jgi:hypothetical protein